MKHVFFLVLIASLCGCTDKESGPKEFYGKIVYAVSVGGMADSATMESLRKGFGDSIGVYFTDNGYRLEVYGEKPLTEWFDNSTGMTFTLNGGEKVLTVDTSSEENVLFSAKKEEGSRHVLARNCAAYFMQDNQFHIEMWYDTSLYISPSRFDKLREGHYNRYYADCHSPYLMRSMVIPPMNIRIEAIRIEVWDEPDPEWSQRPAYPQKPFAE